MTSCTEAEWPGLFRIIDAHPDPVRLDGHGLAALAAEHWRREGRPVPREFSGIRARQVVLTLEAERIIRHVRSSAPGPMILFKGLEVAARYPEPSLRKLRDVDVLVEDVKQVEACLMEAGFRKVIGARIAVHHKAYDDFHQLGPLVCPGMSLPLELHRHPHWPTWETAPSFEELERSAQPSSLGIEGVLSPSPEHHALIVLAHSWARQPFEQLSQLVDFALLLDECDRAELGRTAARWGIGELLEIARRTVDSVLVGAARDPMVVSWFAPQLRTLDFPTPARQQFNRYAVSLMVSPIRKAAYAAACGFGRRIRTVTREKLARRASVL